MDPKIEQIHAQLKQYGIVDPSAPIYLEKLVWLDDADKSKVDKLRRKLANRLHYLCRLGQQEFDWSIYINQDKYWLPLLTDIQWQTVLSTHFGNDVSALAVSLCKYIRLHALELPFACRDSANLPQLFSQFVAQKYDFNQHGLAPRTNHYKPIADHFQWRNRAQTYSEHGIHSPFSLWTTAPVEDLAAEAVKSFRCRKPAENGLTRHIYIGFLEQHPNTVCGSFPLPAASAVFNHFNAHNVLDFAAGWGDRLAAFWATPSAHLYIGADPNLALHPCYVQQCLTYDRWLYTGPLDAYVAPVVVEDKDQNVIVVRSQMLNINCVFVALPAEDVPNWAALPCFEPVDLVFTSPPYFNKERYAKHTVWVKEQSWSRYTTQKAWHDSFLMPVLHAIVTTAMAPSAHLCLNVARKLVSVEEICAKTGLAYVREYNINLSRNYNVKKNPYKEPIYVFNKI